MKDLENFCKKHNYLVCVDSDGCAIDGMTIKHVKCFGPGIVEIFQLKQYEEEILNHWNKVNLYSKTRGINRFKGLIISLTYAKEKGYLSLDFQGLQRWTETTSELSNQSLIKQIEEIQATKQYSKDLELALEWSRWVNARANEITNKPAFEGVKCALEKASQSADIAVVSAAGYSAVVKEWEENELLPTVDVLLSQECGSKVACLQKLLDSGYAPEHIVMLGDSPGDITSAKNVGVLYYPIIPGKESQSWKAFHDIFLDLFLNNKFSNEIMEKCEEDFWISLNSYE